MLLATTMVATALTGCGSKSDSSSSSDDGKIKLTVWSPQEDPKGDNWLKTEVKLSQKHIRNGISHSNMVFVQKVMLRQTLEQMQKQAQMFICSQMTRLLI